MLAHRHFAICLEVTEGWGGKHPWVGHVTLPAPKADLFSQGLGGEPLKPVPVFLCRRRKKAGGCINKHGLAPGGLAHIPELGLRMSSSDLPLL